MNLGELRTKIKSVLNRSDNTDALTDTFIDLALKWVHRELRVPALERTTTLTVDSHSRVVIPSDYLEMIALWPTDGDKRAIKKTQDEFLRYTNQSDADVVYVRRQNYWYLKPDQSEDTEFTLDYYGEMLPLESDTDTDPILDIAWDLVMFAALVEGADHFEDDREAKWEAKFQDRKAVIQQQAIDQDLSEGIQVVAPGTSTEY